MDSRQECIICGKERTAWVWPEGSDIAPIPVCSDCYAGVDAVIGTITEYEQRVRVIFPMIPPKKTHGITQTETQTETQTKATR
jgi:hypothetical protein